MTISEKLKKIQIGLRFARHCGYDYYYVNGKYHWAIVDLERSGIIGKQNDRTLSIVLDFLTRQDRLLIQKADNELVPLKNHSPKKERAKMSNGLRYDVMNRDGFHCVLCGATGKDDKLVVDHIEPVSKGGKTKKENLRTLCQTCNSGKRDKLEMNDVPF